VTDADIELLARTGASVAYCPRASEYFGHRLHRYMEMLEAGVNVCLGTDSIICHGTLSIVDEMRRLHRRDKADPHMLLAMATTRGAAALGLDHAQATLTPGAPARLVAIGYDPTEPAEALRQVLRSRKPAVIELIDETDELAS
jgi:cytosine/adenosine deaminase-related metal-dependent hydrolase